MAYHYRLIDGEKSIALDNLQRWEQLGSVPWRDEGAGTQRYYAAVPLVYRCVDVRANAMAGLPWAITRGQTDVWDSETPAPPADLALLGDLPDWLWGIEAGLCLTATAYLYKLRSRVRVVGVRWLDPTLIEPEIDFSSGIVGWRRNWPGSEIPQRLSLDDVVAVWLKGLGELSPRTPPAQAALSAAGASYNLQSFVAGYFKRGAIKATLLAVEGAVSESERKRLKAWWNRVVAGIRNAFGAEVINAAVKPVVIGEGLKELSNTELTTSLREEIATAFGIPHSMVMSNAANFATSQQDELNFYNTTVLPEARQIQRQLNKQLFEPLGLRFEFRSNELSVFQADENERADAYGTYVAAGMKPSIAAQILGVDLPQGVEYEDLDPQGPEPKPEPPLQEQDLERGQEEGQPPPEFEPERAAELRRFRAWAKRRAQPDPAKFQSDRLSEADKQAVLDELKAATLESTAHAKALVLQLDPDDDEAEQDARMALERHGADRLAEALGEHHRLLAPADAAELAPAEAAQVVVQNSPAPERVRDILARLLLESADLGVSVAVRQLEATGFGFDWTLANTQARAWAAQYAGELISQIDATTRQAVQQATARWIGNGEPLEALIADLAPFFGRGRAELIAATEVTRAYQMGSERAWAAAGVVGEMEWQTVRDERVCPMCGPLHGQRAPLGGRFEGDIAPPPRHPRCRCFTRPVLGDR